MDGRRKDRRDMLQNLAIVFLTLTAFLLFAQTQLYTLGSTAGAALVRQLMDGAEPSGESTGSASASFPVPVRAAVTGVYGGRWGSAVRTMGEDETLSGLLREALGSAGPLAACRESDVLEALNSVSVYWDFLEPLPLPVIAQLSGAEAQETQETPVRRLVLSAEGETAALYLWGEGTYRCETAVTAAEVERIAGGYELNGAVFAMDDEALEALAPCTLLPAELPELPVLTAGMSLPDTETLLSALGFYPRTNSRYPETGGAEVITEGGRRVRVRPDGEVGYWSGGETVLSVQAAGEEPTLAEAVNGAETLLSTVLAPWNGEARLYLRGVRREGGALTLSFGYQLGGVPIRLASGKSAAEVVLEGKVVQMLTLRFRRYTAGEEMSLLLPLKQARAIAAGEKGAELTIGYADGGSGEISASWLAD